MKNKTINIALTLIVIVIFCSYFIIHRRIYNNSDFGKQLEYTERYIKEEKWDEAIRSSYSLKDKWKQLRFITILNYGEGDIGALVEHIDTLIGGSEGKDTATALSSIMYIKDLWDSIENIVPGP